MKQLKGTVADALVVVGEGLGVKASSMLIISPTYAVHLEETEAWASKSMCTLIYMNDCSYFFGLARMIQRFAYL